MNSSNFLKKVFALLLCAVIFGACTKDAQAKGAKEESFPLEESDFFIVHCGPEGTLPNAVKNPAIFVQFSHPVVALSALGEVSEQGKNDIISINPPLDGTFIWYGTSLLCFECSESVIPQKEYTVSVNKKLVSKAGVALTGKTDFSFATEELRFSAILPGYLAIQNGEFINPDDVPQDYAKDVALFFSYPVDKDLISKALVVSDANGKTYRTTCKAIDGENAIHLTIEENLPENTEISITLKAGAQTAKDSLATSADQTHTFNTLKDFTLKHVNTDSQSYSKYTNPVTLMYSHALAENAKSFLAKNIVTKPAMPITEDNIEIFDERVTIYNLPVTYEQTYELTIKKGLSDKYGRTITEDAIIDVQVPKAASMAEFKNYGDGVLEAEFAPKLAFAYQNILEPSWYSVNGNVTKIQISDKNKNQRIVQTVDLTPFLNNISGKYAGNIQFNAELTVRSSWDETKSYVQKNNQVIQVTNIGATVRYGYNKAVVLVSALDTGKPIADAKVSALRVLEDENHFDAITKSHQKLGTATTDENGLAIIDLPEKTFTKVLARWDRFYLDISTKEGDRLVFQPDTTLSMWHYAPGAVEYPRRAEMAKQITFMFCDRGLYRPGETITFRGIDRTLEAGTYSCYEGGASLTLKANTWRAEPIATIKTKTSKTGGFWASFKLPEDLTPGSYTIEYMRDGDDAYRKLNFTVAHFERLRFSASASIPKLTYIRGDRIDANVKSAYLGGGSLAGATWDASWFREPIGFYPKTKDYQNYSFGPLMAYDARSYLGKENGTLGDTGTAGASTNSGSETISGRPYHYRVEFRVQDKGNQEISTSATATVHPAQFYIGLSHPLDLSGFAKKDVPLKFKYALVTPDEEAITDAILPSKKADKKITVELLREEWKMVYQLGINGRVNARRQRELVVDYTETLPLEKTGTFSVTPKKGGCYVVRLSTKDSKGNAVVTEQRHYVSSSDWVFAEGDNTEINLLPAKDTFAVGDTAQIMLQSPLQKGTYLMTIEREGIIDEKIFTLEEAVTVLDVPIKAEYLPVVYVTISTYSTRSGETAKDFDSYDFAKPKGYFGVTALSVDTNPVTFDVSVSADKKVYRPGEKATLTIKATKNGKAVPNAEISLMAVDRGVIDLIDYHVPDPIEFFYSKNNFPYCVWGGDSRSLLIDPVTYESKTMFGGDALRANSAKEEEVRKDFNPTAFFEPCIITDKNGIATHTFTWQDTLTTYRITALGISEHHFALSETELDVANPISARELMPSMLRVGDISEAGVLLSNLLDKPQSVTVSMEITDGIEASGEDVEIDGIMRTAGSANLNGTKTQTVTVDANSTVPVVFPFEATKDGYVSLAISIDSSVLKEKILKPLQIEKPYIMESVATTGQVGSFANGDATKEAVKQEEFIVIPSMAENNKGAISITLDSSRLGVLGEAVQYVFRYPYGCIEQRSSKILPLIYFAPYIKTFALDSEVKEPKKVIQKELEFFAQSQRQDGSFGYWQNSTAASFATSLRVAEVLLAAKDANYKMPKELDMQKLMDYIARERNVAVSLRNNALKGKKNITNEASAGGVSSYSIAYASYLLTKYGMEITDDELDFIANNKDASIAEKCFAGLAFAEQGNEAKAQEISANILNYMQPTTRGVAISEEKYGSIWEFFVPKYESYALSLKLFANVPSYSDWCERLTFELLELQKAHNGYWHSTATTARVLDAFNTYIKAFDLTNTDFSAKALIAGKEVTKERFKGLNTPAITKTLEFTDDELKSIKKDAEVPVVFSKNGTGNLFYTLSLKYALPASKQFAREHGLCVHMDVIDLETGKAVKDNRLKEGKTYKAKVTLTSVRDRTFVALRAPIPAGAEVLNAAFVTTGSYQEYEENDEDEKDFWSSQKARTRSLSSQTIYNSEVQYFWNYFASGYQQVDFLFRAMRKGTYQTPSAIAECMYEPELFGRSSGKVWIIE